MRLHLPIAASTACAGKIPQTALRGGVGAVLLVAALGKMLDLRAFWSSVSALNWLPAWLVVPAATLLLAAELLIAVLFFLGWQLRRAAAAGAMLAGLFLAVTAVKLAQGVARSCDCFGVFLQLAPEITLVIDGALLLACLRLYRLVGLSASRERESLDRASRTTGSRRRLALFTILTVELVVAVPLFRKTINVDLLWPLHSVILKVQRQRELRQLVRNDPLVGQPLPLPQKADIPTGSLERDRRTVILYAGSCHSCVDTPVRWCAQLQARHPRAQVVVVFSSPAHDVEHFLADHPLSLPVAADPPGNYGAQINACFAPRVYLLDETGKLLYIQPASTRSPDAFRRVECLLEGG